MLLGLCYYIGGLMPVLRRRHVWLLRQQSLNADLGGLASWLQRGRAWQLPRAGATEVQLKRLNTQDWVWRHNNVTTARMDSQTRSAH